MCLAAQYINHNCYDDEKNYEKLKIIRLIMQSVWLTRINYNIIFITRKKPDSLFY